MVENNFSYFDSHCHISELSEVKLRKVINKKAIFCLNIEYRDVDHFIELAGNLNLEKNIRVSLSAHPWSEAPFILNDFLDAYYRLINCPEITLVAIGEVGIDRLKGKPISEQKTVFKTLSDFANQNKLPIIIHCVKSFEDILQSLSEVGFSQACMFHDFNGNEQMISRLISHGYYIGFGKSLYRPNSKIYKSIQNIPLCNVLLETDDLEISIEGIYQKFAKCREVPISELKTQVLKNFVNFFEVPSYKA